MLESFGSADRPLRPSALDLLVRCSFRAASMHLQLIGDESGKAADTGSLAHAGVAAWHLNDSEAAGLDAMRLALPEFPLADEAEAKLIYKHYVADPRNAATAARVVKMETKVRAELRSGVHVAGTLDQVREGADGVWRVWDLKTGQRKTGWEYLTEHCFQQAAYVVAAAQTFKRRVEPGGLICTKGYRTRGAAAAASGETGGVFWHTPWSYDDCLVLLDEVVEVVQRIRRGELAPIPGDYCGYCPYGGLHNCLPKFREMCE
jgi:hypothetical protein